MNAKTVKLLKRYVRAVHPHATGRKTAFRSAVTYWRSLSCPDRGKHRKKIKALIVRSQM